MSELKCPNCKGTNVAYAIPDWEDGKLIDHGSFECFDCLFHTGMKNTEAEIMAALTRPEAVERATDKPIERWEFEYLLSEYASGREQLNSLREGLKSDASRARIIPEVDKRVKEIKARLLSVFTTPAPIQITTEAEYQQAMTELNRLVDIVCAYESEHYPIDEPSKEAAEEFRRDQMGVPVERLEALKCGDRLLLTAEIVIADAEFKTFQFVEDPEAYGCLQDLPSAVIHASEEPKS